MAEPTFFVILAVVGIVGLANLLVAGYILRNTATPGYPRLSESLRSDFETRLYPSSSITLEDLGRFEETLEGLTHVYVVANRINDPRLPQYSAIRQAMVDNFQEGVVYVFFVSGDQLNRQADQFNDLLKSIFTLAKNDAQLEGPKSAIRQLEFRDLCRVIPMTRGWVSWPYIFYRHTMPDHSDYYITALRGSAEQQGLTPFYYPVPEPEARALFMSLQNSHKELSAFDWSRTSFRAPALTGGPDQPSNRAGLTVVVRNG